MQDYSQFVVQNMHHEAQASVAGNRKVEKVSIANRCNISEPSVVTSNVVRN